MQNKKVIVVKLGTSSLVGPDGRPDKTYLDILAAQIHNLREAGWHVVVVSSGAIAYGLEALGISKRPTDIPTLQAAASVGQNGLVSAYAQAFEHYDILTSIVLITRHSTANREAWLHARDTIERLLELGVVPIINENDTISVGQIRFGDNDTLAALVSCLIQASICVIFSDIKGLYTADPGKDPSATLIPKVERITPEIMAHAGTTTSKVGSGGMITKMRAARVLMTAGIELVICHSREEDSLMRIVNGEEVGTCFVASETPHEITPRKLWIALGDTAKGVLKVDDGCREALVRGGSSLLSVGIVSVEGSFARGDVIDICAEDGYLFARGLAGAPSSEVSLARGRSQAEIKGNELLVNVSKRPVVHRDELVVFE